MGAGSFIVEQGGKTAQEAFSKAVEEAEYEYGHRGYTGTIAEKDGFVMIPAPKDEDPVDYAERLTDECDPRIDDKWGPAGCIDLRPVVEGKKEHGFVFFGWASS